MLATAFPFCISARHHWRGGGGWVDSGGSGVGVSLSGSYRTQHALSVQYTLSISPGQLAELQYWQTEAALRNLPVEDNKYKDDLLLHCELAIFRRGNGGERDPPVQLPPP